MTIRFSTCKRWLTSLLILTILAIGTTARLFAASETTENKGVVEKIDQRLTELLSRIQEQYRNLRTLRATFTQESYRAMSGETVKEKGTLTIAKPNSMAWKYNEPEEKTVIMDKQFVWLYVPKDRQLYCEKAERFAQSLFYKLLAGDLQLQNSFLIQQVEPQSQTKDSGEHSKQQKSQVTILKLRPRLKHPTIDSIFVTIDNQTFLIIRTEILDHFGNRSICIFTGFAKNPKVDPSIFRIKVKKGTALTDFMGKRLSNDLLSQTETISLK